MFKGKASFTEEKVQQHFALVNQAYNAGKVGSKWDSARTSETLSLPDLAAFIRSMETGRRRRTRTRSFSSATSATKSSSQCWPWSMRGCTWRSVT